MTRRVWAAGLAFWTALALLETTRMYFGPPPMPGPPRPWWQMLVGNLPWWWLGALLTPLVFALGARWPLHGARWWARAGVHAAASLAVSVVHLVAAAAALRLVIAASGGRPPVGSLERQLRVYLTAFLVGDVVTYWAVLGAQHAIDLARRWRESVIAAARLELGLAEARLQALRMELSPHFLFDTLNAISGLVRRHEIDGAVEMLARLGDLLRATLDRDLPQEIRLGDELALLDDYLAIEQVRCGDRLTVAVAADDEARRALVPALALQPLVENALRHGVARRPGPALVRIAARRDGAWLDVEVRDTGEGPAAGAVREGIGLSNTRARLAQLHGAEATLRLEPAPGGGARVSLRLPFHVDDDRTLHDAAC